MIISHTNIRPKDILTRNFLLEHYIKLKKSTKTIAEENNIKSPNSVTQAIKKFKLSRDNINNSADIFTKEFLEEHYVRQNLSLKDVAILGGFRGRNAVSNSLKKHNILQRKNTTGPKRRTCHTKRRSHPEISGKYFRDIESGAKERGFSFRLNIEDIWQLFLQQNKKCALTGIDLRFNKVAEKQSTQTASLDRINNNIGYILSNVRWIHKRVNRLRGNMTDEEFLYWCNIITKYHNRE